MEQFEIDARARCHFTKKHTKKKTGKTDYDKMALKLWSLIVRQRAGRCELCDKEAETDKYNRSVKGLDAHHLVGRRNYLHRYSLNNGVALCKSCHMFNREHSPHYDLPSMTGFVAKMEYEPHLKYRNDWFNEYGFKKHQPTETAEDHYYRLLDVYISMLDGESMFPMELY